MSEATAPDEPEIISTPPSASTIRIRYNARTEDITDGIWCTECGVPVENRDAHNEWHTRIDNLTARNEWLTRIGKTPAPSSG